MAAANKPARANRPSTALARENRVEGPGPECRRRPQVQVRKLRPAGAGDSRKAWIESNPMLERLAARIKPSHIDHDMLY